MISFLRSLAYIKSRLPDLVAGRKKKSEKNRLNLSANNITHPGGPAYPRWFKNFLDKAEVFASAACNLCVFIACLC